ncbi:DNA-processing protein DprA [Microbacterium koreense]|uniref:DNA-processing protein DprA n=1 Tax=Microbacterium koreense TaxID=323761 RepID=A0ABW2ZRR9_9MICO
MTWWNPSADEARERLAPLGVGGDDAAVTEAFARTVWSCLTEPGDGVAGALVAALGASVALHHAVMSATSRTAPVSSDVASGVRRWMPRLEPRSIDDAITCAARAGVSLVVPDDAAWPRRIDDLGAHAPIALWVRGRRDVLAHAGAAVAMVGARAATSYGERVAVDLAGELASGGLPIVSGAAYGIDGAAHRAALHAGGGTIAVVAGGADRPYPAGHADLLDRIAESGAIVAESPCGTTPTKWRFLQRNRLIAALTDATVVVQAGWRSGSLNTAGHAAALGRGVGAVPGPITSAASAGCHRLLREFDATCITSADDVRELIGAAPMPTQALTGRTDDTTRVRDALSARAWRDTTTIATACGMDPARVAAILALMHLEGSAERDVAGWRLTPRGR